MIWLCATFPVEHMWQTQGPRAKTGPRSWFVRSQSQYFKLWSSFMVYLYFFISLTTFTWLWKKWTSCWKRVRHKNHFSRLYLFYLFCYVCSKWRGCLYFYKSDWLDNLFGLNKVWQHCFRAFWLFFFYLETHLKLNVFFMTNINVASPQRFPRLRLTCEETSWEWTATQTQLVFSTAPKRACLTPTSTDPALWVKMTEQ